MKIRKCLVCGHKTINIFYKKKTFFWFGVISKSYKRNKIGLDFKRKFPAKLSFCPCCYHIQQHQNRELKKIGKIIYNFNHQISTEIGNSIFGIKRMNNFIDFLNFEKIPEKILEIGCGNGFILKKFKTLGVRECFGVEPSVRNRSIDGVNFISGYFNRSLFDKEYFDFIYAVSILEHVNDPKKFIEDIVYNLKKDGTMAIVIPEVENSIREGDSGLFLHEHISYFTNKSLKRLMESKGLRILKISIIDKCLMVIAKKEPSCIASEIKNTPHSFYKLVFKYQEKVENIIKRFRIAIRNNPKIGLYGACSSLSNVISWLGADFEFLVFDSDEAKWNKYIPGVNKMVRPPQDIFKLNLDKIVIMPFGFQNQIFEHLTKMGYQNKTIQLFKH